MPAEVVLFERKYRICLSCFKGQLEVRLDYLSLGTQCYGEFSKALVSMPVYSFSIEPLKLKPFDSEIHYQTPADAHSIDAVIITRVYGRLLFHGAHPTWAKAICSKLASSARELGTKARNLETELLETIATVSSEPSKFKQPILMYAVAGNGRPVISTHDSTQVFVHIFDKTVDMPKPFVAFDISIQSDRIFQCTTQCLNALDVDKSLRANFGAAGIHRALQDIFAPEATRDICAHRQTDS